MCCHATRRQFQIQLRYGEDALLTTRLVQALASMVAAAFMLITVSIPAAHAESPPQVTAYIFWQSGCPYCAAAKNTLEEIRETSQAAVRIDTIELDGSPATDKFYETVLRRFQVDQAVVPIVVIGERHFVGYADRGRSASEYQRAIDHCLLTACSDVVAGLRSTPAVPFQQSTGEPAPFGSYEIAIPVLGKLDLATLSLPALTVLLAAIDGFNPCAMWVLVFLIGLLLGLENPRRMWLLGAVFLLTTAVMYFAVMAAWFNLVIVLGATSWLRIAIAALAIGAGLLFLRDFWTRPTAACCVVRPQRRRKMMDALRSVVSQNQLAWSLAGIAVVAVAVNLVELACSAGVPAVYTQILAMNQLSAGSYYFYLALYIAVFMLDDVAIFVTAMIALRVTGLTSSYARYSHLLGGMLLLAIGAIMLLRPELLSFM
jgi:glutaredoxin